MKPAIRVALACAALLAALLLLFPELFPEEVLLDGRGPPAVPATTDAHDRGGEGGAPRPLDSSEHPPARVEARSADVPSSGPPEEGLHTLVLVSDPDGRPVPGASVLARPSAGTPLAESATDRAGEARIVWPAPGPEGERGGAGVRVEKPGFRTTALSWASPPPEECTIVLRPGGTIEGVVRPEVGEPLPEGCSVVAWPRSYVPAAGELVAARATGESFPVHGTGVRPDGSFTLDGIAGGVAYAITAAAPTHLAVPRREARAGERVTLQLMRVFAKEVLVRERGGGPLRCSPRLYSQGPGWSMEDERCMDLSGRRPELALTGIGLHDLLVGGRLRFRDRAAFVYGSAEPTGHVGPLEYSHAAPGYEPTRLELWLEPVGSGLATHLVDTDPAAPEGWGRLLVTGSPPSGTPGAGLEGDSVLLGTLHLFDADGGWSQHPVHADELDRGFPIDLPIGTYTARFGSRTGAFSFPPGEQPLYADVTHTTEAVLPLDLRGMTFTAIEVIDERTGRPYLGRLHLQVRRTARPGAPVQVEFASFPRPPFRLYGLRPGEVRLRVTHPPVSEGWRQDWPAVIDPHASNLVRIHLWGIGF
ncbi:MAG: hypothetical protein QF903_10085 [Planctomycetota bacterium]|nr:hypothetical protein [Planctomycetota bacterium]